MMLVDIRLTVNEMEADLLKGKTAVVIDTLRATSTITTALYHGARRVFPMEGIEEAKALREEMQSESGQGFLLGGERGGIKVEGFQLGNSPLEYLPELVRDKDVILSTTNGTRAIQRGLVADHLLIGSLLNSRITMEKVMDLGQDLVLCCSGTQGHFSLEDFVTAGAMISDLGQLNLPVSGDDRVQTARLLYERYVDELAELMSCSQNGTRLMEIGHLDDIEYCAQKDCYPIVCSCQLAGKYSHPIIC